MYKIEIISSNDLKEKSIVKSPGEFFSDELIDMLTELAQKGEIVGFELVETATQYEPTNGTTRVAAMTMLHFMSQIVKFKK